MPRRYIPITVLTGVLLLVALTGYLIPAQSEGPPTRVLLENKAGKVIFAHKDHVAIQSDQCGSCHHTTGNDQAPPKCSSCHVKKFDDAFIADHQETLDEKLCVTCHHPSATIEKFSHDEHVEEYTADDCQACHHDESIEPEPQACSECHTSEGTDKVVSLRKANHTKCADCHDDFYLEGTKGCTRCHSRKPVKKDDFEPLACSSCHKVPTDQLIPTTTAAFHGQCMGCHKTNDSGPFGDEACYQCHMK